MDTLTEATAPPGGPPLYATTNDYDDSRLRVAELENGDVAVYVYRPCGPYTEYLIGGNMWLRHADGKPEPLCTMPRVIYKTLATLIINAEFTDEPF